MRNKIYLLNALFLFPMWMSKTLQPLYWELEDKLNLFSASYVSMAIAGTFSIIYAGIVRKLGIRTGLIIGYVFYAAGLILRAYPVNLTVAILTGFIAGIGASVTGLALKGLLLEIKEEKRKKVILQTDNIYTLSQSLGALAAGVMVSALALISGPGYQQALIITGLLTLSSVIFIPKLEKHSLAVPNKSSEFKDEKYSFSNNRMLYSAIFLAFFIHGASWAIVLPLIPVYLKDSGMSASWIGATISAGVIAGLILKNLYISFNKQSGSMLSLGVFTLLTCLSVSLSFHLLGSGVAMLFAGSVVVFYMFRTVLSLIIDLIEVDIAGKSNAMSVFGIRQTAFLCGDVAGGIAMPFIYKHGFIGNHTLLFSLTVILASFLVASCSKLSEKLAWKETMN
ncbi:MFS transporter [Klebsiella pneumoniae]|uniref:MFS transporter n=1 Tax=Klebsiella pneumoniae TaxID=573 RepID=UPI000665C632|nr:MFS transporter [Klebsiella pneumoniae]